MRPLRACDRRHALLSGTAARLAAPSIPDPLGHTPYPPAGDSSVEVFGVGEHPIPKLDLRGEPGMASVQIGFVDWPVCMSRHLLGVGTNRAPEIAQVAISVIDRFVVTRSAWPPQKDGQASGEWFDVVRNRGAERAPQNGRHPRLPPEPGERRLECPPHGRAYNSPSKPKAIRSEEERVACSNNASAPSSASLSEPNAMAVSADERAACVNSGSRSSSASSSALFPCLTASSAAPGGHSRQFSVSWLSLPTL